VATPLCNSKIVLGLVWRLDRLARSLSHLIETVNHLAAQQIAFRSITENIDTSSATGQLVFHIFGALAEFERNLIKERTIAGLIAARARGKSGGRPKRSPKASKVTMAKRLYADKGEYGGGDLQKPQYLPGDAVPVYKSRISFSRMRSCCPALARICRSSHAKARPCFWTPSVSRHAMRPWPACWASTSVPSSYGSSRWAG
jgi:hypothetical protein